MFMNNQANVSRAAQIIRNGGIVAFPTETVYGLGANALDESAVARVFDVKERPRFDPLIVHISDQSWIPRLVTEWPETAEKLARIFWPGPLTLVLPKSSLIPDLVTSGCPTVAIRIPDHPIAIELLREAERPIAAPSANPFGRISPTTAAHVEEQLGGRIDMILDGGPCQVGVESTVLQLTAEGAALLRPGGISVEDIEEIVGQLVKPPVTKSLSRENQGLPAPGNLESHYAPTTPLQICHRDKTGEIVNPIGPNDRVGLLSFTPVSNFQSFTKCEVLSEQGDLREAAANFFAALRRLDAARLDLILADFFPEVGLGRALNDRLRRAIHA